MSISKVRFIFAFLEKSEPVLGKIGATFGKNRSHCFYCCYIEILSLFRLRFYPDIFNFSVSGSDLAPIFLQNSLVSRLEYWLNKGPALGGWGVVGVG